MRKIGLVLALVMLLSMMIQSVQAADVRVIGTSEYVVFLKDDGSLEYYEVINSIGYHIGYTPPGWRNDRLGRQLVHVSYRNDGARAELWHLSGDVYYVDLYRAGGGLLGSGSFSAAGIAGGQGNFAVSSPTTATGGEGQTTIVTNTQITTSSNNAVSAVTTINVSPQGGSGAVYVVVYGDTLAKIARNYGVSLVALMNANSLTNPNLIYAGQRLIIP